MSKKLKALTAGVAVLLSGTATAQFLPSPLARFTQLDCAFTASAAVTWVAGQPHVEVHRGSAFTFRLDNIDTTGGTARFIYGAVDTPIAVVLAGSAFHFIDRRLDGSMAMTTVLAMPGERTKFRATYSHTQYYAYDGPGFASIPQVEQYYGYCASAR